MLVTFIDVSTVVQAEAHLRTLVEELNHRVRNMLTVVGAVATQTLARTPDPAHFAETFLGRIQAMARPTAASREDWDDVRARRRRASSARAASARPARTDRDRGPGGHGQAGGGAGARPRDARARRPTLSKREPVRNQRPGGDQLVDRKHHSAAVLVLQWASLATAPPQSLRHDRASALN